MPILQWISEVLHFCQGLPIILVGCKNDLRHDQKTIEELAKTSQKPVTPEQVCRETEATLNHKESFKCIKLTFVRRVRKSERRSVPTSTSNARPKPIMVFAR